MNTDLNLLMVFTGLAITSAAIFTTSFLYFRKQRIAPELTPESKKIADYAREKALKEYATYKQNTVVPFKGNPGVRVILPNESIGETQIRVLIKGKGLFGREVLLFSKNYDTVTTQIEMVSKSEACDKLIKTTIAKHLLSNHIRNTGGFKTKSFVEILDGFIGKEKKPKEDLFKTFDSWPKEIQDQLIENTEAGEKSLGTPAVSLRITKDDLVGLTLQQKQNLYKNFGFPKSFVFRTRASFKI